MTSALARPGHGATWSQAEEGCKGEKGSPGLLQAPSPATYLVAAEVGPHSVLPSSYLLSHNPILFLTC